MGDVVVGLVNNPDSSEICDSELMHPMHAEKAFPFGSKVRIPGIRTDIQDDSKIVSNSQTESILSYFEQWAGRDSNPWPPDYQSGALAKLSYQPTVV